MAQKKVVKRSKKAELVHGEPIDPEQREAPLARRLNSSEVIGPVMNEAQLRIVTGKTPDYAIRRRQGPGGRSLSYVSHGYVTDQLNKAFGFDWDLEILPMANGMMYALENEHIIDAKTKDVKAITRHVAVCGKLTVRIHDPKTLEVKATIVKSGFGSQIWLPTMELGDALKAARSDLIKTCATQLGVALDLYWNDQAEVEQYQRRMGEAERMKFEAEAVAALLNGAPKTPVLLISRAQKDLKMSLEDILDYTTLKEEAFFDMDEVACGKLWAALQAREE